MRSQTIKVPAVGSNAAFDAIETYAYDSLNRIQSATETVSSTQTWKQTFSYDRYGNRTFDAANTTTLGSCSTAVCNPTIGTANNRFSTGQGYSYDADGAVTQDATGQRFGYDSEDRQKEFYSSSNAGSTPDATYSYDGSGQRVKKIAGSEVTVFVYDASGQLAAEYSTQIETADPKVSYLTTDHLGSPRVVTDQNGAVVSRKDFTAFGEAVSSSQRTSGTSGNGYDLPEVRQDYTGHQKDDESGLEYAQARYYNSAHGRFTSPDPLTSSAAIKNPQTFNRYSYVLNSPYKFTDPLGLMGADVGWQSVAGSFWGTDVNGTGRTNGQDIINAAEAIYDRSFRDIYDTRRANALVAKGKIQEAKAIVDANDNLQMLKASESRVETSVAILGEEQADSQYNEISFFQSLFQELWRLAPLNYGVQTITVNRDGQPDPVNQCAVRFSQMLLESSLADIFIKTFKGTKIHKHYAIKAQEMANWVASVFGKPQILSGGNVTEQLSGRTGIVFIKDFPGVDDSSHRFNHIDLWNGNAYKMSENRRYNQWLNTATKVYFWEVP